MVKTLLNHTSCLLGHDHPREPLAKPDKPHRAFWNPLGSTSLLRESINKLAVPVEGGGNRPSQGNDQSMTLVHKVPLNPDQFPHKNIRTGVRQPHS